MSNSMKELKEELTEDCNSSSVSLEIRDMYFKAFGTYDDDGTIYKWYSNLNVATRGDGESTGAATDFYDIIGCKNVDDLAEYWGLKGDEFNCLKAIAGIALGARHSGTNPKRDANKLVHYANRIKNRLDK